MAPRPHSEPPALLADHRRDPVRLLADPEADPRLRADLQLATSARLAGGAAPVVDVDAFIAALLHRPAAVP